jgi:PTS system ascorbate-specific IIA component
MPVPILLIAHAPLASALRSCVLHVFPDAHEGLQALDVPPDQSLEDTKTQLGAALESFNVAQKVVDGSQCKLIAGVNLPMLLRTVNYRHESLDALVTRALTGGSQCITQVALATAKAQTAITP